MTPRSRKAIFIRSRIRLDPDMSENIVADHADRHDLPSASSSRVSSSPKNRTTVGIPR